MQSVLQANIFEWLTAVEGKYLKQLKTFEDLAAELTLLST